MTGRLAGIRVLDLTRILAGPFATMVLAHLGAEVIKVENPDLGDDSRAYGPFIRGESPYFMSLNRNKKSITLNLHHSRGKQILRELVKISDVLVGNFRPRTMEKLDLGYDSLKNTNPSNPILHALLVSLLHQRLEVLVRHPDSVELRIRPNAPKNVQLTR